MHTALLIVILNITSDTKHEYIMHNMQAIGKEIKSVMMDILNERMHRAKN